MGKFINLAGIDFAGGGSAPVPPVPPGPTPVVAAKDVNLRDYDGTIIASYTAEEFAALTDWPAAPVHEGLIAEGWEWSLLQAQAFVAKYGKLDIYHIYYTEDGVIRLKVDLPIGRTNPVLNVFMDTATTIEVDWGDGSDHDTKTSTQTGNSAMPHVYAHAGVYEIVVKCLSGRIALTGSSSPNTSILLSQTGNLVYCYINSIIDIQTCRNLYMHGGQRSALAGCNGVSAFMLENASLYVSQYHFYANNRLKRVYIPEGKKFIDPYAFGYCRRLTYVMIPSTVTTIQANAFIGCDGMKHIFMMPAAPPSITNTTFGIPSDAIIYVPADSVAAYKAATNWAAHASKIQPIS